MNRQGWLTIAVLVAVVLFAGAQAGAGSFMTIVVVDHTGPDLQWFADLLLAHDAANPMTGYYGLMAPSPSTQTFVEIDLRPPGAPNPRYFEGIQRLVDELTAPVIPGPSVPIDAFLGAQMAFENIATYPTDLEGTCVILMSEVGHLSWGSGADAATLEAAMLAREATGGRVALNAIVDHGFYDGTSPAMGIRHDATRVADGAGGYTYGAPDYGTDRAGVGAVVDFARTHGSAWDLAAAKAMGADQDSFRKAFRDVKVVEFGGVPHIHRPVIPEPGTWLMVALGGGLLLARRRRR